MLHGDVLGERARLTPDRLALVYVPTGERLRYRDLDARALRLAHAWRERLGLAAGDRVGLLAHNCPEFIDAFFAAAKSGVILVPLSTRATAAELEGIVADSGMKALLYGPGFLPTLAELRPRVRVDQWVALDASSVADPSSRCSARCSTRPPLAARPATDQAIGPEHPLCLLYTSGTTGRPKGSSFPTAWWRERVQHRRLLAARPGRREPHLHAAVPRGRPRRVPAPHLCGRRHHRPAPWLRRGGDLDHDRARAMHRGAGRPHIYKLLMDAPAFAPPISTT